MSIRKNIVLDDKLVRDAFRFTDATTTKELVEIALREFIRNHSRRDIKKLAGKIKIYADYDHKKLRERK